MAAEIIQINSQDFTSQEYEGQDINLISTFDINTYLSSSSYIESFIYDNNKNLLSTNYNFSQYTVLNNGQSPGTNNNVFQIEIDPELTLINQGYDQGQYNVYYNFFNKQIGSVSQQLYISEISSDRTEIRLDSTSLTTLDILEQVSSLIQQREDSPYFLDFYLNFGENQLVIANNIQLDNQDPTNPTPIIKLYEALPAQFDLSSTLWVVTQLEESTAYQVTFEDTPIVILDTISLNGPNFNIPIKDQINNSTVALDYNTLTSTTLTSSFNQLSSLLEEKEIDINIDYTDFNNFVHFGSAQARLENFYYKISLLEDYSSSIVTLNGTTNNNPSASIAVYESKINNIITNFDGYEYYLYYNSGSWAWPKTTTQPPYQLSSTTSTLTANWYPNILLSASNFDNDNQNNLYYSIPEYLREDPSNEPYQVFVEMVGQFYDNIWVYYKDVTEKYNADNRLEYGISKDIVADAIRDFGIRIYQNNFSVQDLYTAFIGLTPQGGLFPFPNITGSLPTPTGFEYVDTLISASNDYIPLDDVNKSLYKRIYHNLPYLLKSKGTLPGLRALITSYGIPDTVLRINEYGGKDKSNTNDWDYWENTFNYTFYTSGSNYMYATWAPINSLWDTNDGVADSVSLRFKTDGLPFNTASISFQSLWNVNGDHSHLVLRYEGTGYVSGSYPGSIPDPYNQYAYLDFYPSYNNDPTISASIYLPFYNGDWWSAAINREGNNFTLLAGNKIYEGGNNGTSLGFYATSSAVADDTEWVGYGTSYFARGGVIINGNTYTSFSGSLQEVRYFTSPLSESVFKDYIMNPHSIEGNTLNSTPDELIFRASLGGELYTESISIHPRITGSWVITSSFVSDSNFAFLTTPTFNPNTEYFFYDQVAAGIQNAVSDKIRIESSIYPSGSTLSPFRSLAQNLAISQSYTANTNLLEVAFSPQDEINQDIMDQLGYFNIGEFIGDPRFRSSSLNSYPNLDILRNSYFEKYTSNYDLNDYIRLIKFFDNSLFKMIKDFVPARTSLASGIVIKQHLLERNRYPQPQVDTYSTIAYQTSGSNPPLGSGSINNIPFTFQDISVSGTIAPQWNNYNPGTIENFSGGTGGTFEMFNGINTSPYGPNGTGPQNIYFITQSWNEGIVTPLGIANTTHDAQDEFYDGEFSGSILTVTTQSLFAPYPLNTIASSYRQVHYYSTSSVEGNVFESLFLNNITAPQSGSILFYNKPAVLFGSPSYQIFTTQYLKIARIDCSGSNNTNILENVDKSLIYNNIIGQYVEYDLTVLNEQPTYYLYKAIPKPYTPALWPNEILDYKVSASNAAPFIPSSTTVPTPFTLYGSVSGNVLGYFNSTTGVYDLDNTPNTQLYITASVNIAGTGTGRFRIDLNRQGNISTLTSVTVTAGSSYSISSSYYGLQGDQIYLSAIRGAGSPQFTSGSFLLSQSRVINSSSCDPVIFEPYITDQNYYYSDYNPLMNNINEERLSSFYEEVDYYPGITTPTNFNLIISGSALKAAVQDSNYTSKRVINPRYNGVKSTSHVLNQWTPGDTGTYGKTPTVESLKTAVAYCDWIGGWPPERMNASAIHIQYLIKSDGTIVIPDVSENSLFENKGNFETGERLIISSKTVSTGQPTQYRNILRGGTRIEPILYSQIGHTPPQWAQYIELWNNNVNYLVSDVTRLSTLNSLSPTNPIAQLLPAGSSEFLGTTIAGASNGWTILYDPASTAFGSGNYDYNVTTSPNPVTEGINLIVESQIKIKNLSVVDPSVVKIDLRNSFIGANTPLETQLVSLNPDETKIITFYKNLTPGVDYNDNNSKGDIHFKIENQGPSNTCAVLSNAGETYFNVKQSPLPNPLQSSSLGTNNVWNYPTNSIYNQESSSFEGVIFIPDVTSSLNVYYNTPGIHQSDITGSGFNPIVLDWSVKYGDEFRFEGDENRTFMVKSVYAPTDQSPQRISNTGSLEIHLDKSIPSQSINLDHFVIRRYIDDPAQILMEGYRPINSSGPYIVRPEYVVPELDKSVDQFILDLTQKGLL